MQSDKIASFILVCRLGFYLVGTNQELEDSVWTVRNQWSYHVLTDVSPCQKNPKKVWLLLGV